MRISLLPCVGGEKAVIRLLPQQNPFSGLEDLGLSDFFFFFFFFFFVPPDGSAPSTMAQL
jgi:general secretion pathway protein E/type IV pilus assembly protein PilB